MSCVLSLVPGGCCEMPAKWREFHLVPQKRWKNAVMKLHNAPRLTVIRALSFLPTQWPCKCVSKKLSWISQICHRSSKIKAECKSNFRFISTCFLDNNLASSAECTQSSKYTIKRLARSILDSRHFYSLQLPWCPVFVTAGGAKSYMTYITYQVFVQNEVSQYLHYPTKWPPTGWTGHFDRENA